MSLIHSTYSFILATGLSNFIPCQFSTIAAVLVPRPMMVLSPETMSRVVADIDTVAGVLAKMLMIEVPSLTLFVNWDIAPSVANDSRPQDSGTHMESTFS